MAAETLSRLLIEKEHHGLLKGFKLTRRGDSVTHLMFADDIILFGEATVREARSFLDCLNYYCNCLGQAINFSKSSVYFSRGVAGRKAQVIAQTLGMRKMNRRATYLGIPLFRSVKRTEDTKHLIDRVLKRIQGWKVRLLSSAGKTCLIKAVGSSLSNYVASSDVIPSTTANKVDKLLWDFWWGDTELKRKLHLAPWDLLCKPKSAGGLGFRATETMNRAFLMKWAWKILIGEDCLWRKVMNDKYIKNQNFLDLEAKPSDSILWKAILRMRTDLGKGICRKIGDGNSTSIWFDPWVPGDIRQPIPCVDDAERISLVSNFITNHQWNADLIRRWFRHDDAKRILNISLPGRTVDDSWLWLPNPSGEYSIKSAYRMLKNVNHSEEGDRKWKSIWGAKIHNRLKMFWWKILANCIPTKERLSLSIPIQDTICSFCSASVKDNFHLFWECIYARAIWFGCSWSFRADVVSVSNWDDWLGWFSNANNRPSYLGFNQLLGGAAIIFESIVEAPPEGWVACNSDVAIGQNQSSGAAVFRDNMGTILRIASFRLNHCDPLPGEVSAVCESAAVAVELGYKNIVFQCDSLNAVAALKSKSKDIHNLQFNIQDNVHKFLSFAGKLNLWEIIWTPRTCNGVAHSVAHWANRNNKFGFIDLANFDDSLQLFLGVLDWKGKETKLWNLKPFLRLVFQSRIQAEIQLTMGSIPLADSLSMAMATAHLTTKPSSSSPFTSRLPYPFLSPLAPRLLPSLSNATSSDFLLRFRRSSLVAANSTLTANSVPAKSGVYTVGDFMTTKDDLHVVKPTTTVDEALETLVENRITGFPVIDEDWTLVGLVSDYDLLALDSIFGGGRQDTGMFPEVDSTWKTFNEVQNLLSKTNGKVVGDVMTPAPVVVRETTNLEDAARFYFHAISISSNFNSPIR
uniref:CBS domain-containing protein n=1 Tax=Cannabis sativa TaxID=3483 RepID=A0A803PEP7_CANSA